jgi:hypothetical protein
MPAVFGFEARAHLAGEMGLVFEKFVGGIEEIPPTTAAFQRAAGRCSLGTEASPV